MGIEPTHDWPAPSHHIRNVEDLHWLEPQGVNRKRKLALSVARTRGRRSWVQRKLASPGKFVSGQLVTYNRASGIPTTAAHLGCDGTAAKYNQTALLLARPRGHRCLFP